MLNQEPKKVKQNIFTRMIFLLSRCFAMAVSLSLHLICFGLIGYFSWPIAKWYLNKIPILGIDFYNSATYVSYLLRHFSTFISGWKYIWYEGTPFGVDYPFLNFYLMMPFVKHFDLIKGIQMFAVATTAVFLIFSYLLFFELGSNWIIALILTVGVAYSHNTYRALIWAGGMPYYAAQMFLPLCLFLGIRYLKTNKKGWLYSLALFCGLGMLAHPQPFITAVFPLLAIFFLFWVPEQRKFFSWQKIKDLIFLSFMSVLIALPAISNLILNGIITLFTNLQKVFGVAPIGQGTGGSGSIAKSQAAYGAGSVLIKASQIIIDWAKTQYILTYSETHFIIWLMMIAGAATFIIALIFSQKRLHKLFSILPFCLGLGYVIVYIYLFSVGVNLNQGGWYKVFWPVPVAAGALASFLWGGLFRQGFIFNKIFSRVIIIGINFGLAVGFYLYYPTFINLDNLINLMDKRSIVSSAFPHSFNARINELDKLKKEAVPSFFDPNSKDYRLYVIDATFNIWWNSFFDLPLARGYIDPPYSQEAGTMFWLNAALGPSPKGGGSSLVVDWNTPEEIALKNTRFLLDWFSIKYFEGNHYSRSDSVLAPNIIDDKDIIDKTEAVEVQGSIKFPMADWGGETVDWRPWDKDVLNYYKVKDELVSPIFLATNASVVAIIGDEASFDTLARVFGLLEINSQKLIFVRGSKYIDDWSLNDFVNFDALILYGYEYKNYDKAWRLIGSYLKNGGKVFVDTGMDNKESNTLRKVGNANKNLPSIFPISQTIREGMGKDWEIEATGKEFLGINFNLFSPLDYEGSTWNISHPPGMEAVSEEATGVLKNKGYPVIVSEINASGGIIWSGLNLPYHITRNFSIEEAKLFKNLLIQLVDLEPQAKVENKIDWISPETRIITSQGAKGVLLKEQHISCWSAILRDKARKRKLKIYSSGPSNPGFMYVRIPTKEAFELTFQYHGDPVTKIYAVISFLTILIIFDYVVLRKKVIIRSFKFISGKIIITTKKWWEKDEKY